MEKVKANSKEKVPCRYCRETTEISETQLCKCGVRLYTTKDLRERELSIKRQLTSLNSQLLGIAADRAYRERLMTMTDMKGNVITREENFWKNVHGTPKEHRKPREEKDPLARALEALKVAGITL